MNKEKTCCFTGHRPDKLPWGEDESDPRCGRIKGSIARALEDAYTAGCRRFISGMARGGDLYFAEAVLELRKRHRDVELECARPCQTQADSWPEPERRRYQAILDQCNFETLVQHSYDRFCMMRRNQYMVDRSRRLIAVYNGVPKGGTYQTLLYAMRKGLSTHILDLEDFCQ